MNILRLKIPELRENRGIAGPSIVTGGLKAELPTPTFLV
jgi:hypothetical protein